MVTTGRGRPEPLDFNCVETEKWLKNACMKTSLLMPVGLTPEHLVCNENSEKCNGMEGCVIVVEILERQTEVNDEQASEFFFRDLADSNLNGEKSGRKQNFDYDKMSNIYFKHVCTVGENKGEVKEIACNKGTTKSDTVNLAPRLTARVKACSCIGHQLIGQSHGENNQINNPQKGCKESNSADVSLKKVRVELCVLRLEDVQTDLLLTLTVPISLEDEKEEKTQLSETFLHILRSFTIEDWSLFI